MFKLHFSETFEKLIFAPEVRPQSGSAPYAKILGEKLFRTWEIPRSGSKAEDGEKKRKNKREREKEERKYVITMAKLRMAHASRLGQFIMNLGLILVLVFHIL